MNDKKTILSSIISEIFAKICSTSPLRVVFTSSRIDDCQ